MVDFLWSREELTAEEVEERLATLAEEERDKAWRWERHKKTRKEGREKREEENEKEKGREKKERTGGKVEALSRQRKETWDSLTRLRLG